MLAALLLLAGFGIHGFVRQVRTKSMYLAMFPRQPAAALDQFFLEYPYRLFVRFDELYGPGRFIKSHNPVDGEDLARQFPLRRHWMDSLLVQLPDGTTVRRNEVIAAIGRSGLIATYPAPQDSAGELFPDRTYRLDIGVSYCGWRVVDRPPDPEGREGRDQDGIHTYRLPGGARFEITYRGGVPDGPFRAFRADGTPWGEATYRDGRVVEAWVYTRAGRRFDELNDVARLEADAAMSATELTELGRAKLAAGDHPGALKDLTTALEFNQTYDTLLLRSDARFAAGDLPGAIDDCNYARQHADNEAKRQSAQQRLNELHQLAAQPPARSATAPP